MLCFPLRLDMLVGGGVLKQQAENGSSSANGTPTKRVSFMTEPVVPGENEADESMGEERFGSASDLNLPESRKSSTREDPNVNLSLPILMDLEK